MTAQIDANTPIESVDRVKLEITVEQARALSQALDVYTRLALGQIEIISELVSTGEIPRRREQKEERRIATMDDVDDVRALAKTIKTSLGYSASGSNGLGHRHVSLMGHRAYELQKVVDKAISTRPGSTAPACAVSRDGLSVRYTQDPAPIAKFLPGDA